MRPALLVIVLSSCALGSASLALPTQATTATPPRAAAATVPALERIAVIGASMSAGFRLDGNVDPFAKPTLDLATIVEASLNLKHDPLVNEASQMFFMDSRGTGEATMKALTAAKPTLVVALDYLFWFGYGEKKEEQRLVEVEAALEALAKLGCTVLVGDLPDMTVASITPDPVMGQPMLQKVMLPKPATLEQLNKKITAFAAAHPKFIVVPLAGLTAKVQADAEVVVRGNKYPKGSIDKLLQGDRLHTTLEGTCAAWVLALDTWMAKSKDIPAGAFELDVKKLAAKVGGAQKVAPKEK